MTAGEGLAGAVLAAAQQYPDAIAIDAADGELSYESLASRASERAGHFRHACHGPRVGLAARRDTQTYVSYLAILLAGKTVVPLDMSVPGRTTEIVSGAGLAHIADGAEVVQVNATATAKSSGGEAYLLYTSGSTGKPKGIPINHSNVLSYLRHVVNRYGISPGARLTATFGLMFDLSVHDIFASWTSGATLVLPRGREHLLPATYVNERDITHWFSVPSAIRTAQRLGRLAPGCMRGLRWSLFCGEQLLLADARAWQAAAPGSVLENLYGPTELTVACAQYRLPKDPAAWPVTPNDTVPIGQAYPHLESLIDSDGQLLVRGPQRFSGYLDEADNAGRFCDGGGTYTAPSAADAWYATGDRVAWHDGELVHLGRADRQVKVQGFRVELTEVEQTLRRLSGISAAYATTSTVDGQVRLVAAVETARDFPPGELTGALRKLVPAHLVPGKIVVLEEFPLLANGKVDGMRITELIT